MSNDLTISETFTISVGGGGDTTNTVTLDLNGHALKYVGTENGSVIKVASSGDLTLRDSDTTARHKFTVDSNGLWTLSESGGTQTVTGGVITGGKGEQPSGNSSSGGGGVYVDKNAAFTMEGGNITGNSSDCGGSVCTAVDKNFTVSGSVKTTDNVTGGTLNNETGKYTGGTDNNVYLLYESTCIDIGGALSNGAQIGVTNVKSSGANSTKVFTSGWKNKMSGKTPTDYFTSDNSDLIVTLSSNELQLSERPKEKRHRAPRLPPPATPRVR